MHRCGSLLMMVVEGRRKSVERWIVSRVGIAVVVSLIVAAIAIVVETVIVTANVMTDRHPPPGDRH